MRNKCFVFIFIFLMIPALLHAKVSSDTSGGYDKAATKGSKEALEEAKGDVKETMNDAQKAMNQAASVNYKKTVPQPEDVQSAAKKCLDGILDVDFGFGLNIPSIKDILGKACEKINSEVKDHLRKVSKDFSPAYFDGLISSEMGFGAGGDVAPVDGIDYNRKGREISDNLWKKMETKHKWLD